MGSRTGALLIPITAVAAVVAVAVGGYVLVSTAGPSDRSAQAATLTITARHAVALLEQERQQMIVMADASRSQKLLVGPKVESKAAPPAAAKSTGSSSGNSPVPPLAPVDPGTARADAEALMPSFGFSVSSQFGCLDNLWSRESGWSTTAENPSGAYGIPQALPGSKMASAGADWQTNDKTQIKWGLGYIKDRYSTPCGAWAFWQANGSY